MRSRPLQAADIGAVVAMLRESFPSQLNPYLTYAQPGVRHLLGVQIAQPGCFPHKVRTVATGPDDVPVAFAELTLDLPARAFLSYVCVAPHARGKGVAAAMIEDFLRRHPGVTEMELDVFADNEPALRLYHRLGFTLRASATWARRDLPSAGEPVPTPGLTTALAAFDRYGFCEVELHRPSGPVRVGRIGPDVLRCHGLAAFADDDLLATARAVLPGPTQALTVVGPDDVRGLPTDATELVTSLRLGRSW